MEKNLKTWIWIIIILVVIAIILYFVFASNTIISPITTDNQGSTGPESAQDFSDQSSGAGAVAISYADALVKYADRRIQLDTTCQAYPNNVNYKDNTGIMIDNRSPNTRTVKVGITFTIKPWAFKIVVLPDIYLASKTILVDCDQSQNVATILVQE